MREFLFKIGLGGGAGPPAGEHVRPDPEIPQTVFCQPDTVFNGDAIGFPVAVKFLPGRLTERSFSVGDPVAGNPDCPCMVLDDAADSYGCARIIKKFTFLEAA